MLSSWVMELGNYLYANKISILSFGGLLLTSAVKVMPPPGTPFSFYTFLYDWTHQFFNLTNTRLATTPINTPPAAAQDKQS
jgi:hypothetical protein